MVLDPRPSQVRPSARSLPLPLASLALLAALVTAGCGGAAEPISRPEGAVPASTESVPDAPESVPEAPEATPVNASPEARVRPPRTPPPPPEVEPRSEWSIDDSIETPEELEGLEVLAKFPKGPDVVIIYRAANGDVYRRVQGALGAYTRVEESKIELDE